MTTYQSPPDHLLTPAQVAALVFVDPKTVSRWARAGKIPSTRTPGGHRRFLRSDVQALLSHEDGLDQDLGDGSNPPAGLVRAQPDEGSASVEVSRAAVDAVVAEAIAIALEAHTEAVLETAASVAVAAQTAARAAVSARRVRAYAAAEAAQLVANEASAAAAAIRSQATAQAGVLAEAVAQAKRLVVSSGTPARTRSDAVLVAVTVQAAAGAASAEAAWAAARVAEAVTDAAACVAALVAAFDLSLERETAATAALLHNLTVAAARRAAQRNHAATGRTSSLRSVRR